MSLQFFLADPEVVVLTSEGEPTFRVLHPHVGLLGSAASIIIATICPIFPVRQALCKTKVLSPLVPIKKTYEINVSVV